MACFLSLLVVNVVCCFTSFTRNIMSKRERIVVSKSIWSAVLVRSSYVPIYIYIYISTTTC